MNKIIYAFSMLFLVACNSKKDLRIDLHSFSEPHHVITTHLDLNVEVDFENECISGEARYHIENKTGHKQLILDSHGLQIHKVTSKDKNRNYFLGEKDSILGQPLIIELDKEDDEISVFYRSAPNSKALQWLSPEQTAGKRHPFLFTQSQAILARSWLPCQDSPGVRFTYEAQVKVPNDLLAVMSAENPREKNVDGVYTFKMEQAIPAYLMALGVGNLEFRDIGARTGVYAEPALIEKSVYEFAETENMLRIAEEIYGAYAWDRFDILVLPPSFPYGGMENPRLTFVTPTILAGDRSLTSLIAHELAHSWSGNLVTNKTWNDFWLNEGFTVYFERRIMERLEGIAYSDMLSLLGRQDLDHTIETIGHSHSDTHLKLDLSGRDPVEALTDVAYEKGFFLLRLIEQTIGRKQFDFFLKKYFSENAFQVMDTESFVSYINDNLLNEQPKLKEKIRLEDWVYGPGIPENCPTIKSDKFKAVDQAIQSFERGYSLDNMDCKHWSSHEWLHFLRHLPRNLTGKDLKKLDVAFNFSKSGNSEILNAWFLRSIPVGYKAAEKPLEQFLMTVGRRKFLKPLYEALYLKNPTKARRIYKNARGNYHSVSRETLDELIL